MPVARGSAQHELRTGMNVRLVGFQSEAMNGARGRLGKYSEKQGSWQVFLDSSTSGKAVRPRNLEPTPDQPADLEPSASRSSDIDMGGGAPATGVAGLASSPVVAAMAAAMRGVVPVPTFPHFDGPGPPPGPEWQEDTVPADDDKESWVELMRDAYVQQLRADAEHPEPPPFHRANHFSASSMPGQPLPEGKYPKQALNFQLQMLLRARSGDAHMAAAPYAHHGGHHGGGHYGGGHYGGGHYGGGDRWMPGRRFGGKGSGGYGGMPRGPPRWMPVAPGAAPGAMGQSGEPPRIVFPPPDRG